MGNAPTPPLIRPSPCIFALYVFCLRSFWVLRGFSAEPGTASLMSLATLAWPWIIRLCRRGGGRGTKEKGGRRDQGTQPRS
eukprot:3195853-Pyramimonas_sp.AAC.1